MTVSAASPDTGWKRGRTGELLTMLAELTATPPDVLDQAPPILDVRQKRAEAAAAVAALHRLIKTLDPASQLWRLQANSDLAEKVRADPELLRLTWSEEHVVPLDPSLYEAVLTLVGASESITRRVWDQYGVATRLHAAAKTPVTESAGSRLVKNRLMAETLTRDSRSFTGGELHLVDTDRAFAAHLCVLKERAGIGVRTLQRAMKQRRPKISPSSSTLAEWLRGDRLPAGEAVVQLMVTILLEKIDGTADPRLVTEHVRVWRMLLVRRHAGDTTISPARVALARIAAWERAQTNMTVRLALRAAGEIIREALAEARKDGDTADGTVPPIAG